MKFRIAGLPIIIITLVLLTPSPQLYAQQQKEQSRQDRIREHQERIKKILEESKRRREAQQQKLEAQQPPTAPGAPGAPTPTPNPEEATATPPTAAVPGQALPTGPVQARLTPTITKAKPTPAPKAPQTARSESRTILLFHPMDSIVSVGERFKTEVMAETKEGRIDEISFLIKYPRHILNPLALNHSALDPYVKNKIDYEFNPDEGTIFLHAKLEEPERFAQKELVSIIWEALEPSDGAAISYEFGSGDHTTGLYLNGSNLLGTMPGSEDGVIKTTVQVMGPRTKPTVTKMADNGIFIGTRPPQATDDRPEQKVSFDLRPSTKSVRPGETFDVDVILRNPGEERIDRVQLYLQFDPTVLEVVDNDIGNVVSRGININDADARKKFPFDFYRYNYADNEKGIIVYEISSSNSQVRGTGKIATITLKAIKNVPRTEIVLVQNAEDLVPTSNVSFLGESKLHKPNTSQARPLDGFAVQVEGKAIADQDSDNPQNLYNPFESNLARRMRNKSN